MLLVSAYAALGQGFSTSITAPYRVTPNITYLTANNFAVASLKTYAAPAAAKFEFEKLTDLLVALADPQRAWQVAQPLAGLHRGPGQNDPVDLLGLQRLYRSL